MGTVLAHNNKILISNNKAFEYISSYQDGDNMEWGSNILTDLTGTSWYFNEVITLPTTYLDNLHCYVNFTTINGAIYSRLETTQNDLYYFNNLDSSYTPSEGWLEESYRTVTFTGGTDVTNSALIAWIQANATQIT